MSLLSVALETLEEVELALKNGKIDVERLRGEIQDTVRIIKDSEKNLCADCQHDRYSGGHMEEPTNTCSSKKSEFYGFECPIWYGDEICDGFEER